MTSEEIADGNVLIAHFMGLKRGDDWEVRNGDAQWCHPMDLKYNTSWDWLMPVVEKIESMGGDIIIYYACTDLNYKKGDFKTQTHNTDGDKKIVSTLRAVVKFIKWYYEKNNIEKPKPIEFYEG